MISTIYHEGYAVVIALGKAHDHGHTSIVYCLKISDFEDDERIHVEGNPFRLLEIDGWNGGPSYVWKNADLRKEGIGDGSIVTIEAGLDGYLGNTGKKMEIDKVLSQLQFGSGDHGRAFTGIAEAFPDAVIPPSGCKGIYQNTGKKPYPPYALISVLAGYTGDDRIAVKTRSGEVIDLHNRSREHKPSGIENVMLQVQEPSSEDDVGDVILVAFGSKTSQQNYVAVCEGILSSSRSGQTKEEPAEPLELSCYPMGRCPRGICLIINNLCFHMETKNRLGGERDEMALGELFKEELNFEVHVRNDLENYEMQKVAEEFARNDHSEYDAFVCIIMSHGGERGTIEGVKGRKIRVEDLTSEFKPSKCPSLAGKPKVFIIQACRGPSVELSMQCSSDFVTDSAVSGFCTDSTLPSGDSPDQSDFLYAFATVPGYVANRDEESGSLFIQTLVEVIREYRGVEHLSDMLAIVNYRITATGSQVSSPSSTLRHKLYL